MATVRVDARGIFPEGLVLTAYPKLYWSGLAPQLGDPPGTTSVDEAVVDEHGFAELHALEDDAVYYIGAQVAGVWHWKTARTPVALASTGGGGGGVDPTAVEAIINAHYFMPARRRTLGAVSGSITPDLAQGNIFLLSLSGDTTIHNPVNAAELFPVGTAIEAVFRIITNGHKVTLPDLTKWTGNEEPYGLDGSVPELVLGLVSWDDAVTFEGFSNDQIPASFIPFSSTPTAGQVGAYNATTKKLDPVAKGLTKAEVEGLVESLSTSQAEVDARIAALSILTSEHPMTYTGPATAAGQVFVTTSTTQAAPVDLQDYVLERAQPRPVFHAPVTANTTLSNLTGTDLFVPVTTGGVKVTLPTQELLEGRRIGIRNESGEAIKVKGVFSEGAGATEVVIEGNELVYFVVKEGSPDFWVREPGGQERADRVAQVNALATALDAGAFAALSSLGGKVEEVSGFQTARARLVLSSTRVELRGVLAVKAGEELKTGERLCTLPTGKRPKEGGGEVQLRLGGATFNVGEDGKVVLASAALPAATQLALDGVGFPIA